jgi:signal transduction histidine kinase/response regulator RpfG family c-di-GMP phosphodiesterase
MLEKNNQIPESSLLSDSRREILLYQAMLRDTMWLYFVNITDGTMESFTIGDKGQGMIGTSEIKCPMYYQVYLQYMSDNFALQEYRDLYRNDLQPHMLLAYYQSGHEYYEKEIEIMTRLGTRVWVRIRICFQWDETNHKLYGITFIRDITDFKEMEASRTRYQKMIETLVNSYGTLLYCDLIDKTIHIERSEISQIRPTKAPIPGDFYGVSAKWIQAYIDEEDQDRVLKETSSIHIERILPKHNIEIVFKRKSPQYDSFGQYSRCLIAAATLSEGKPESIIVAIQDITEQKHLEEERNAVMQHALIVANQANQAKTDFLSRMSHDIRTPMNAIIGMTAIAATHMDDKSKVEDCLNKITLSGKHLLTLINEVLDMSKLENNKLHLSLDKANIREMMQQLLAMLRPMLQEKNQTINCQAENLFHEDVICDEGKLRQIMMNLLSNAIKYTPEGGQIKVTIKELPLSEREYRQFQFVVEDNGIGMSQDFLEKIFLPFERAEDSRVNKIHGTGLGMAIVQGITRIMNGDVTVQSRIGVGSRFEVTVPLKLCLDGEKLPEEALNLAVLVVDDDMNDCQMACEVLDLVGLKSEWVSSGAEAIQKISAKRAAADDYYMVFLDWKMPEMDGVETAHRIREEISEDVPIIILTAYDWCDIEEEARAQGINEFMSKPISESKVFHTFERISKSNVVEIEAEEDIPVFDGKRVLLVEDNELNVEIAQEMLENMGFTVDVSENGQEAVIQLLACEPYYYDCVLMDVQMPVMNGHEATRLIRREERVDLQQMIILAMTADAFAEDVRKAIDSGMNGHIAKPLQVDVLRQTLHKWI